MAARTLKIISTGPGLTVQDAGRPGWQKYAVVQSGAMDLAALKAGQVLLGNSSNSAALELSGASLRLQVRGGPARIALTGAPATASCDGHTPRWNSSIELSDGEELAISPPTTGSYSYVHFDGGIRTEPVLGSRATHVRSGLGGLNGRLLQNEDVLDLAPASDGPVNMCLPEPDFFDAKTIRITAGANADLYSEKEWEHFLGTTFAVTAQKDRMGARLSSQKPALPQDRGLSGISDAVVRGDIQIDGSATATVLLADHQPTGGYPRIATLITADFERFAQLPANARFRFVLVNQTEALEALRARHRDLEALTSLLQPMRIDPSTMTDLLSFNLVGGVVSAEDAVSWKGYL